MKLLWGITGGGGEIDVDVAKILSKFIKLPIFMSKIETVPRALKHVMEVCSIGSLRGDPRGNTLYLDGLWARQNVRSDCNDVMAAPAMGRFRSNYAKINI